ncbi:DEAD-domain-containing protein [Clathrospora elynae]|uniref:ATP-dependent RNA helicase n=1 Tax=Clathrospora elynae TaxID=706981 RepID=A0A6A5T224_9PLEO|nr:DEAD-domain-containing protein [Clathrospora elynae]
MAPQTKIDRSFGALTPALSEWIIGAVDAMGFVKTTPVQHAAIPMFMKNSDVVVEAVTGSGKTLAFLIPIVERLLRLDAPIKKHHVGAIIISPTRELATQIYTVLSSLLRFHAPSAALLDPDDEDTDMEDADAPPKPTFPPGTLKVIPQLLLGGSVTPAQDLSRFLKSSTNVLIGTPGRLLELLSSPHVHCSQSSFDALVLDEADRLLDLGFKDDLQKILSRLPKQRRTGLFSASVSEAVDQLIRVGLRNPVRIAVKVKARAAPNGTTGEMGQIEDRRTPASLQMAYLVLPPSHKLPAIKKVLSSLQPQPQKSIMYLATCFSVDYFQHVLPEVFKGYTIVPLHGKHPDKVRRRNFTKFLDSVTPSILLTTDVAARGLDIPAVDLVLQLDAPSDPKTFIHRCGRAGRAGRKGLAITFIAPGREEDYIEFLRVRQTPVSPLTNPDIAITSEEAEAVSNKIRKVIKSDRAHFDKAQRGFVSWVRAYSKHTASSIFRVADLDWKELGNAWGLLKLPSMPELKKWEGDRSLGVEMDFSTYAYKDKAREQQRQTEQQEYETNKAEGKKRYVTENKKESAWTQQKDQRATKELRREKKAAKREHERVNALTEDERKEEDRLNGMIEEMRKKVAEKEAQDAADEFAGFSD